jgi:UDP-N-acetylmuramoylalanine--D-glutamate ligase
MKKVTLVLGLGKSGIAAAEYLIQQGQLVLGIEGDAAILQRSAEILRLKGLGLFVQPESDPIDWERVEECIVSPGISPKHPLYAAARQAGVRITGEAELALPHFKKPLVAVTGTNGKTTVVMLVEHILNCCGIKAKALGNVGSALCSYLVQPTDEQAFVVELSSYQLETLNTPVFDAAILMNLTPDHLDRYDGMQAYAAAKFRLQGAVKENGDFFVQAKAAAEFPHLLTRKNYQIFDVDIPLAPDENRRIEAMLNTYKGPTEQLKGRHDRENAIAAWLLCRPFSISIEQFWKAFSTFRKPPHRIEFVKEIAGVAYYDDSKGTNLDAVIQAVNVMQGPVVLIVGGVDKGASYALWKEPFLGKVKEIIAIGQAASQIYQELHPYFTIKLADSLDSAVHVAASLAEKGDVVLLSPGCSSFDMFRDYAHRGEEFQRIVQIIEGRRDHEP